MSNNSVSKTIYLDYAATTPLASAVHEAMLVIERDIYGNPSSMHREGRRAFDILEQARLDTATAIGAKSKEIIFTGSGTESDNLAIIGIAHAYKKFGRHIIVSAIEHKAVLAAAHRLESEGFEVTYLPVSSDGLVNIDECMAAVRPDTILISIMYANNEIGTIEPITLLTATVKTLRGENPTPLFHTDSCQAVGMLPVDVTTLGIDLMTINSSKIYGPKGIGLLYLKSGVYLEPLIVGGDQESGRRAGTENVALAHGFALALKNAVANQTQTNKNITSLRDYFIENLFTICPDIILNGHKQNRLSNNVHVSIPYIEGESLVLMLDKDGVCCSTGSACSAIDLIPSHVLRAIGINDELIHGSLRFSLGTSTTKEEIDYTVVSLEKCISTLRSITAMPHMWQKNTL
ncbi:hypothetical protein A2592_02065 [Candidatus Kaiserbacteria bacterium RIFOXYD1_FULL_42_15]|uniref:Aminotransferase class V domain-containing protein n=1 Tax=Candidatus Kaiserbacteria bacterium RIFOXYD1_FULL_42_15 TaxID=1798532 RepID=A0A1F6FPL1_9BACT|nr:MAG: hypothetical protein A2592_02065 [Candidatus Kaiserbacteria bacterium RIFOXYD1_FULL_42_15]